MINSDMELHLSKLNNAENVLLIAMRDWVSSVNQDKDPRPFLAQAFGAAGISDAAPMFDDLMLLTAATAIRGMDIRCEKCDIVGTGEKDILSVNRSFNREGFIGDITGFYLGCLPHLREKPFHLQGA